MMLKLASACVLLPAGLMLVAAGGVMLLAPEMLHAKNGVTLGDDPSLLSEIRAPGGFLTLAGLVSILCAFFAQLRLQALMLTAMIYGSFGVARLLSMGMDGRPSDGLIAVTVLELTVGLIAGILATAALRRSSQDI